MAIPTVISGLQRQQASNIFLRGSTAKQAEIFMTIHSLPSSIWRTASFADSSHATSVDNSALGEHLNACRRCSGSLFAFQREAELMHGFFASRFVTTLALIAVIIGLCSLVL